MEDILIEQALSRRPDPTGDPDFDKVHKWLEEELKRVDQFLTNPVKPTYDIRETQELTELEWELFQALVRIYGPPSANRNWTLVFLWALSDRYSFHQRIKTKVEYGKIFYDLESYVDDVAYAD